MLFKRSLLAVSAIAFMAVFSHAEGHVTYTLHKSDNPTADELDAYQRITTVMDSAVYLYNKYTNLRKFINVYYAPGVPTAEASSNGDLRFGSERSYMFVGTAMHEMAHTMGMGTTTDYRNMFKDGVFKGEKAQALLKEIDGPDAELHGDSQHFWPYGLNYASEVHSEQDLINHARIVDAMYQDIFKEAFYKQGRVMSLSTGKCMGRTSSNALELMDCGKDETLVNIFSMGENPVTYRIELGDRVIDIPNESTTAGVVASTYGYNGGAHQKYLFENAPVNMPNAFQFKNSKSGLYLQAVGTQVQQNRLVERDESFIWQIRQEAALVDTSTTEEDSSEVVVVPPDSSDSSGTDRIMRVRDLQPSDATHKRMFDLKGRSVRKQPLGRTREIHRVIFEK